MTDNSELNHLIDEIAAELGVIRGRLRRISEFGKLAEFEMKFSKSEISLDRILGIIRSIDSKAVAFLNRIERKAYLKNIGKKHFPTGSLRAALGRK